MARLNQNLLVKKSGAWSDVPSPIDGGEIYAKFGGKWHLTETVFVKDSGTWKNVWPIFPIMGFDLPINAVAGEIVFLAITPERNGTYQTTWQGTTKEAWTTSIAKKQHTYASVYNGNVHIDYKGLGVEELKCGGNFKLIAADLPRDLKLLSFDKSGNPATKFFSKLSGNVNDLPPSIEKIDVRNSTSDFTGTVADFPNTFRVIIATSTPVTITGNIEDFQNNVIEDIDFLNCSKVHLSGNANSLIFKPNVKGNIDVRKTKSDFIIDFATFAPKNPDFDAFRCNETNVTTTATSSNLPRKMESFEIPSSNGTFSGNIRDLPRTMENLMIKNINNSTLTGNLSDLPPKLYSFQIGKNKLTSTPAISTKSNDNITGNISDFPSTTRIIEILDSQSTISGDTKSLSNTMRDLEFTIMNNPSNFTCNLADLKSKKLGTLELQKLPNINLNGDLKDLINSNILILRLIDIPTANITCNSTTGFLPQRMNHFEISNCGLTSNDIDNILIGFNKLSTFSPSLAIDLDDTTNPIPTATGLAAKAALITKGVIVHTRV